MPELERWVLHRLAELDARIRARGREPRLDRRLSGELHAFCVGRPLGVLLRRPQGRALLRPAGQPAPPRGAHGARPSAPLPRHLARPGAVLHRRGGLARAVRRGRQRASADFPGRAGGLARRRRWRRTLGADPRACAARRTAALEASARREAIGSSLQAAVELRLPPGVPRRCSTPRSGPRSRSSRDVALAAAERAAATIGRARRREMRPLLARAAGGRAAARPSRAVPAAAPSGGVAACRLPGRGRMKPARAAMSAAARPCARRRCCVLAADQASKWWVLDVLRPAGARPVALLPVLNLTMVWNQGVTFGLLRPRRARSLGCWPRSRSRSSAALAVWLRRAERGSSRSRSAPSPAARSAT